jgi:hypothetical protein
MPGGENEGLWSKFKKTLGFGSGGEAKKNDWRWPAILGVVAGVALGGPIGLGAFAGLWSSSKSKDPNLSTVQNTGLQAVGATTGAICSGVGAAIGTAIIPIIGTLFGAVVGAAIGVVASKVVINQAKKTKFFKSKESTNNPANHEENPKGPGRGQQKTLSPENTPVTQRDETIDKNKSL